MINTSTLYYAFQALANRETRHFKPEEISAILNLGIAYFVEASALGMSAQARGADGSPAVRQTEGNEQFLWGLYRQLPLTLEDNKWRLPEEVSRVDVLEAAYDANVVPVETMGAGPYSLRIHNLAALPTHEEPIARRLPDSRFEVYPAPSSLVAYCVKKLDQITVTATQAEGQDVVLAITPSTLELPAIAMPKIVAACLAMSGIIFRDPFAASTGTGLAT